MIVNSQLGMNYGNTYTAGPTFGPYNADRVIADLQYFWSKGIRNLRVAHPTYTQPTAIANALNIIDIAKPLGFYISWGVTSGGSGFLSTSNYGNFETNGILPRAVDAQNHGVDEFAVGNEEWLNAFQTNTFSIPSLIQRQKQSAIAIRNAGIFKGKITLAQEEGFGTGSSYAYWTSNPPLPGIDFDKIGLTLYANSQNTFEGYVDYIISTWGSLAQILEWSDNNTNRSLNFSNILSEDAWATEINRRYNYLKNHVGSVFKYYAFTGRWDQDSQASNNWFLENSYNLPRPAWTMILNERPILAQI